jgi:hypothetical protein
MWDWKSIQRERERESYMCEIRSLFVTFPCKRDFLCAGQVKSAGTRESTKLLSMIFMWKRKQRCDIENILTVYRVDERENIDANISLSSLSQCTVISELKAFQCSSAGRAHTFHMFQDSNFEFDLQAPSVPKEGTHVYVVFAEWRRFQTNVLDVRYVFHWISAKRTERVGSLYIWFLKFM